MRENLQNQISKCFGIEDKKFAGHPLEIEQAEKLMKICSKESIELDDLLNETDCWYRKEVGYIRKDEKTQEFHNKHISEELKKVEEFYKKKVK